VVKKWGSTMLLEIQTPDESDPAAAGPWDVTIPLHLRYLEPSPGGSTEVQVPWPVVFWACTADDGTKFPVNPFDRTQLGYDGLFGPRTMFYHLDPAPRGGRAGRLTERIAVPVLGTEAASARTIETLTVLTIGLGFLWVLWKLKTPLLSAFVRPKEEKPDLKKRQ